MHLLRCWNKNVGNFFDTFRRRFLWTGWTGWTAYFYVPDPKSMKIPGEIFRRNFHKPSFYTIVQWTPWTSTLLFTIVFFDLNNNNHLGFSYFSDGVHRNNLSSLSNLSAVKKRERFRRKISPGIFMFSRVCT